MAFGMPAQGVPKAGGGAARSAAAKEVPGKPAKPKRNARRGYPAMPRITKRSRRGGTLLPRDMSIALVAKLVPSKQVKTNEKARAAIDKEWDNLVARDCWDIKDAEPWRDRFVMRGMAG